jgi:cell division protein FtsZ
MSLLRRLAHVGLGRRDDEEDYAPPVPRQQAARPSAPPQAPRPQMPPQPPRPAAADQGQRPVQPRPGPHDNYRPKAGELDEHGRPTPAHRPIDDDQLEIPAFLRRQAN